MKCDELKAYGMNDPAIGDEYEMYKVSDVDAAIAELKAKLETVNDLVKASRKFLDDAMEAPTFEKDKEIARLKESVKFFSDTLHRESDSAKECFRFLMDEGLICGWGITDKFFVTAKYSKESLEKFESQEAENERLKKKLEDVQASAYAESVDAGMENRKLKRALWMARHERACAVAQWHLTLSEYEEANKWDKVVQKTLAKAKEYE